MAQQWANFYRNVATQNPAHPNALARSQLMEALAKGPRLANWAQTQGTRALELGKKLVDSFAARGAAQASNVLLRTGSQLASKFKHAKDFGVIGNYSKANAAAFRRAIHQHINSPAVRAIEGTYHKAPVTHYLNPSTGVNVIADRAGNFIRGWKLSPGQLQNVLTRGGL